VDEGLGRAALLVIDARAAGGKVPIVPSYIAHLDFARRCREDLSRRPHRLSAKPRERGRPRALRTTSTSSTSTPTTTPRKLGESDACEAAPTCDFALEPNR